MPEAPKEPETIFALSSWELKHWARSGEANLPWEYWAEAQRIRSEFEIRGQTAYREEGEQ